MSYSVVVIRLNLTLAIITIVSMVFQLNPAAADCPCDIYKSGGDALYCRAQHSAGTLLIV